MPINILSQIENHSLDTLLIDLISGRGVIDSAGKEFSPLETDSRSILEWFRGKRQIWEGSNKSEFLKSIVQSLQTEPPEKPSVKSTSSKLQNTHYRISKVRISRFGGLHEFGELGQESEPFEIDFQPDQFKSAVMYGKNGCGKSCLMSAVCWCLTGYFFQPQGIPIQSAGKQRLNYSASILDGDSESWTIFKALPFIPMPSKELIPDICSSSNPTETWVEVVLVDDQDNLHGPYRRTATIKKGIVTEKVTESFASIGLSQADLEIGTRLPAMLPHLRFDEKNDFGQAVAKLIDIHPLVHVARHADLTGKKIKSEIRSIKDKISESITRVQADRILLNKDASNLNAVDLNEKLDLFNRKSPEIEALDEFEDSVKEMIGNRLEKTVELLGDEYDLSDTTIQKRIIKDVNAAEHFLQSVEIRNRTGMQQWMKQCAITKETLDSCNETIKSILNEAEDLAEIQTAPDRTPRIQLYARIASWLNENDQTLDSQCPVCGQSIEGKIDPVTGEDVQSHIQKCCIANSEAWSKAPEYWAKEQIGKLNTVIPIELRRESDKRLRLQLGNTFVSEVTNSSCFQGALQPLAVRLSEKWNQIHENYTDKLPEISLQFPTCLDEPCSELWDLIKRIKIRIQAVQAVQKLEWNPQELERELLGDEEVGSREADSLRQAVDTLHTITSTTEPLEKLFEYIARIRLELERQEKLENEVIEFKRAIDALEPLKTLSSLVERQVLGLLEKLKSKQQKWLNLIYRPARTGRPEIDDPQLSSDGQLGFQVEHRGTLTDAHHIANASQLRAALVAFWLAYWQYQLESRGGLQTILLDDPQDLFDEENQLRLARAVPDLVKAKAQTILSTNKLSFFHDIEYEAAKAKRWEIDWRPSDPAVQLLEYSNELFELFIKYKQDRTDLLAQELSCKLRIYAETRLVALFRFERPESLGSHPTLMPITDCLRQQYNASTAPFDGQAVRNLISHDGCTRDTELYRLLNDAHHSRSHLINSGQVDNLLEQMKEFLRYVNQVWDHCQNSKYLSKAELTRTRIVSSVPGLPTHHQLPIVRVPIGTSIAAASSGTVREEAGETEETFLWEQLGNIAIYQVFSETLGLSVPSNARVIVSLETEELPRASSLVIALREDKILARRIAKIMGQSDTIVLRSENLDPRNCPPDEVVFLKDVRILPIIGVIWDFNHTLPRPRVEALLDEHYSLERLDVKTVQPVTGISAEPVVLSKQLVLLGSEISWNEIHAFVDTAVSVELVDDDDTILKVVSSKTLGPRNTVRMLHPLGGKGESEMVRGELPRSDSVFGKIPQVRRVRPLRAVLYETAIQDLR